MIRFARRGFLHDLAKLGIRVRFARSLSSERLKGLITERTRVIFGELISNPFQQVLDVPEVARAAHEAGVPLFVDSTTATPYIAKPLSLGADGGVSVPEKVRIEHWRRERRQGYLEMKEFRYCIFCEGEQVNE